jgi:thiol:disulfide interchange protein DsbG
MKPSSLSRCLIGFCASLLAVPALAVTPALAAKKASSSPPLPAMLASLAAAGKLKVVSQFDTEVPGLTGYIVHNQDGTQVVYGDHGYLIVGHVISPHGTDLTDNYRQRYSPKPDFGSVVGKLDSGGHLINEGRPAAPLLYVFADPNCIFCYHFYRMAEPLVASGRLHVRWVMVGFLHADSLARATTILSAPNPLSALHTDEDRFDTAHESGGVAPARTQDKALEGVLQAHLSAMDAVGGVGTPTLLYRDEQGHWGVVVGMPSSDWLAAYVAGKRLPANPNG